MASFWGKNVKYFNALHPFIVAIILFFILFLIPFSVYNLTGTYGNLDLSEYINNPVRILNGELPYRDFWLIFPIGEVLFPALIYLLFNQSVNALLIASLVISSLIGVFSFMLGKYICKSNLLSIIIAFFVFFIGVPVSYVGPTYNHMYILFLILGFYLFLRYMDNEKILFLLFSGIAIGLSFLFRFYEVGAALLAIIISLIILHKRDKTTTSYLLKSLTYLIIGIVAITGPILIIFHDILGKMINEVSFESVSHGTSMNLSYFTKPTAAFNEIQWINGNINTQVKALFHFIKFFSISLLYILPFIVTAISLWYLIRQKINKRERSIILLFLLWGILTFPKALGRSDLGHLSASLTPIIILFIFLLNKCIDDVKSDSSKTKLLVKYGLITITIVLLFQPAMYIKNTLNDSQKASFPVITKYGTLLFSNKDDAHDINMVIKYINSHTVEGEYIFVTPALAPPFYALTKRRNSTYYDSLIDLVSRPSNEKQERICSDLIEKETKLIIHNDNWGFDGNSRFSYIKTCGLLQNFIRTKYNLVETYGTYDIYQKK